MNLKLSHKSNSMRGLIPQHKKNRKAICLWLISHVVLLRTLLKMKEVLKNFKTLTFFGNTKHRTKQCTMHPKSPKQMFVTNHNLSRNRKHKLKFRIHTATKRIIVPQSFNAHHGDWGLVCSQYVPSGSQNVP